MGRSVWTHSDAIETVFFEYECDDSFEWNEFIRDVRDTIRARFPSFQYADRWPERESHEILYNELAEIVISEYCGLVSLGIVPRLNDWHNETYRRNFAERFCLNSVAPFLRETYGRLARITTMSNGEGVYRRIEL